MNAITLFLSHMAIGFLLSFPFLGESGLRREYFRWGTAIALGCLVGALVFAPAPWRGGIWPPFAAGGGPPGLAVALLALLGYFLLLPSPRRGPRQACLWLTLGAGFFGIAALGVSHQPAPPALITSGGAYAASFLASALLLGWTTATLFLGHWYLVAVGLSFTYLQRGTLGLLILLGVRVAVGLGLLAAAISAAPGGAGQLLFPLSPVGFFLWPRLILGLILPGVFAVLAHRCALIKANQSATGILYAAVTCVICGELLARYLAGLGIPC